MVQPHSSLVANEQSCNGSHFDASEFYCEVKVEKEARRKKQKAAERKKEQRMGDV